MLKVQDYTSGDIERHVVETFLTFTGSLYPGDKAITLNR